MPEIKIIPDREKAAARGVSVSSIANTISAAVGSLRVGKYTEQSGHRDDIRIKLEDDFNKDPKTFSGSGCVTSMVRWWPSRIL